MNENKFDEQFARLLDEFESAEHWGIEVTPTIKRKECPHKRMASRLVSSSGNKDGELDYHMPYCEDCGMTFSSRGRFRCVLMPVESNLIK